MWASSVDRKYSNLQDKRGFRRKGMEIEQGRGLGERLKKVP